MTISAKQLNERAMWGAKFYEERFTFYLTEAMRDGYLPGQTHQTEYEEMADLMAELPQNQMIAMDMSQPAPVRAMAQEKIRRHQELMDAAGQGQQQPGYL